MRRITLILVAVICSALSFAQTGATCNDAIPQTPNSTCVFTNHTMSTPEMWFAFNASSTDVQIKVVSEAFGTNTPHVHNISLFGGICASPNLIAQDELPFIAIANDLTIDASGLVPGNTYYIRAKVPASATACTAAACPGTTTVSFVLCIQDIDVFLPLDFSFILANFGVQDIPIKSHTYYTNKGQIVDTDGNPRRDIKLYTTGATPNVYITDNAVSYVYSRVDTDTITLDSLHRVDMTLVGGNPDARVFKTEQVAGYLNYFLGHIPNGITKMNGYSKAVCNSVYPNIDMQLYSNPEGMKYYFIRRPGGDPDDIVMKFEGATSVDITADGGLRIVTPLGVIEFEPGHAYAINPGGNVVPMPWQAKFEKVTSNSVKFKIHKFPSFMPLIIQVDRGHKASTAQADDWSSFLGSDGNDVGVDVVTDNSGNAYFLGETGKNSFPNITGSLQASVGGAADLYVLKFNSDGVSIWGTFYGGTNSEFAKAIALNSTGDVYFVGTTRSSDFPLMPLANSSLNNIEDGFIVRLDNSGATLKSAIYFGGNSSSEEIRDVVVDGNDNAYIVGVTSSTGSFPTLNLTGAYNQGANSGGGDGFIAKFDDTNTQLWGSFFGGSGSDNFSAIVVSTNDDVFISGSTNSTVAASSNSGNTPCDVPGSALYFPDCDDGGTASIQGWGGGSSVNHDAIIVQFNSGGQLKWSTYVGGRGNESSQDLFTNSIAIHPTDPNIIYLVCWTDESTNMFITGGGNSYVHNVPVFTSINMTYITKFEFRFPSWGSLFGCEGAFQTRGQDIIVDNSGTVYITGDTRCNVPTTTLCDIPPAGEFPICRNNAIFFQDDLSGNAQFGGGLFDGYIAAFNPSNELIWSTYYGGNADENIVANTYDAAFDRLYLTGTTQSTADFPLLDPQTGNYMQFANAGGVTDQDAFIARFNVDDTPVSVSEFVSTGASKIKVFPNPTESTIHITLNSARKAELSIYNTLGALVYSRAYLNEKSITVDLANFSQGVYVVKLVADKQNYFSKVVKK
ncbi:hypothetical protein COB64_04245 [Candidatus Wolfebacteria bacterium]|nr:MAG: hypothetical protein COB64_04245 [Candidatus Wolfebacteria bacterium]